MAQIAALYFRDSLNEDKDTRGERNMCLAFGVAFFLATMIVFVLSESYLELGILEGITSLVHFVLVVIYWFEILMNYMHAIKLCFDCFGIRY